MYAILFENGAHEVVASDLATVIWILKLMFTDVLPDLFHRLRSRQLCAHISIGRVKQQHEKRYKCSQSLRLQVKRIAQVRALVVSVVKIVNSSPGYMGLTTWYEVAYMKTARAIHFLFIFRTRTIYV